jgi:hypothetical protein
MSLAIHTENLDAARVTITSSADRAFDTQVRSLFQGDADELLKLRPFLAIVSNRSTRTMVAYTLSWVLKPPRGNRITHCQYKYPDAVADALPFRGNELRPGEQRIDAMGIELDCGGRTGKATEPFYLRQFAGWFEEFADIRELHIHFDAIIFADGEMIGPNESHLDREFSSYLGEKESCYRSILKALDSGHSITEAFRPIEVVLARDLMLDMQRKSLWDRQAAAETRDLRSRYGDEALAEILRKALRKEPFRIHRTT